MTARTQRRTGQQLGNCRMRERIIEVGRPGIALRLDCIRVVEPGPRQRLVVEVPHLAVGPGRNMGREHRPAAAESATALGPVADDHIGGPGIGAMTCSPI